MINCSDPKKADIVIIGANYDKTSSFGKGADKGPAAILECLNRQVEVYERFSETEPALTKKICYLSLTDINKLSPEQMVNDVSAAFKKHFNAGKFVIMLGGEHSISNGPFKALAESGLAKDVTIVQIDAHSDLRNDDSDYNLKPWGKYAHSAVMRRGVELGFKTVQIGVRAYCKDEAEFIEKHKKSGQITIFEWGKWGNSKSDATKAKIPTVSEIIKSIKTEKVYLTIDVDGIDPSHMPATGTPVQGGLEWYYTLELIRTLLREKNVVAADIVEVAPRKGESLTEYGAAQICYNIIAEKRLKK